MKGGVGEGAAGGRLRGVAQGSLDGALQVSLAESVEAVGRRGSRWEREG